MTARHSQARCVVVIIGALFIILLLGCGNDSQSSINEKPTVVTKVGVARGSVTLPEARSGQRTWSTKAVERLLQAQEGVRTASCQTVARLAFAARWICRVQTKDAGGIIVMRVDQRGIVSSVGNGIPGLAFGRKSP